VRKPPASRGRPGAPNLTGSDIRFTTKAIALRCGHGPTRRRQNKIKALASKSAHYPGEIARSDLGSTEKIGFVRDENG